MSIRGRARLSSASVGLVAACALAACGCGASPAPKRSFERAMGAPRAGATVVLPAGDYGRRGGTIRLERGGSRARPITIRGPAKGPPARILGHFRIDASHVRLEHLLFDGPTGQVLPRTAQNPLGEEVKVWVRGQDVELSDCEVRNDAWHAGIYVTGRDARILRCHVHNNGDRARPGAGNLDQGVYWDSGSGVLANCLIDHNVAFGVQLYKQPAGVKVLNNTVVHNGRAGIIVSAGAARNVVANNIVAYNGAPEVSFDLQGRQNVLAGNLFWQNGNGALASTQGLTGSANFVADPRFRGQDDYRLRPDSPALRRALPQYPAGTDLGAYQSR